MLHRPAAADGHPRISGAPTARCPALLARCCFQQPFSRLRCYSSRRGGAFRNETSNDEASKNGFVQREEGSKIIKFNRARASVSAGGRQSSEKSKGHGGEKQSCVYGSCGYVGGLLRICGATSLHDSSSEKAAAVVVGQRLCRQVGEQAPSHPSGSARSIRCQPGMPAQQPAQQPAQEMYMRMPCLGAMGMTLGCVSPLPFTSTGLKVKRCRRWWGCVGEDRAHPSQPQGYLLQEKATAPPLSTASAPGTGWTG